MKRDMRKIESKKQNKNGSQGSITVFFVVILLSVILLTGSMVDLSRIQVADNKMDSSMRAATKSLMSEYNEELLGAYGIFACDLDKNTDKFEGYLKKNLELSSNGYIKYEYISGSAQVTGNSEATLDNNEVLERQIKDYMGTKKIVNKGERVLDRVLNGINSMLTSNDMEGMMKNSSNETDKLLEEEGTILKNEGSQTTKDTALELEQALDLLEEDFEKVEASGEKVFDDFMGEAAGAEYDKTEVESTYKEGSKQREERLKAIRSNVSEMIELARALDSLREALERELDKEEPDYARVDSLLEQIQEAENEYDYCCDNIREIRESEDTKKAVQAEEFDFSSMTGRISGSSKFKFNFEELSGSSGSVDTNVPNKANKLLAEFLSQIDSLVNFSLADAADKDTVMEYVLDRCTYATSGTERELSYFQFGEAEYIINGNENQMNNLLLSATEMFIFCYVINVIDLILSAVPPFPTALLLGVPYAFQSLYELLSGDKYLPFNLLITKGAGIQAADTAKEALGLQYSDLLYLQLAKVSKENMLNRLRRLMLANINHSYKEKGEATIQAQDMNTEVVSTAQAKINMLFLPMFSLDKLGIDSFSGTEYTITKRYKYTYQLTPEKE